jgi:hypothetical protein
MEPFHNDLENLARRVQEGNLDAKVQLERQLKPSMARLVRRVLERGQPTTNLERKILVVAQRLDPQDNPNCSRSATVAHNLCQMIIHRLWPSDTQCPLSSTIAF